MTTKPVVERAASFKTISGRPIDRLYTAGSLPDFSYERELGDPGAFPYAGASTSGVQGEALDDEAVRRLWDA